MIRKRSIVLFLACTACDHSAPFDFAGAPAQGPYSDAMPRRLTFGQADDRHPSVAGGMIVFSRQDGDNDPRERCLAFLSAEGGRIERNACPPSRVFTADTFLTTLVEPALSPDGSALAYMWVRGAFVSALSAWSHELVIASAENPITPRLRWDVAFRTPDGRLANALRELTWVSDSVVRFLGAFEQILKVKGGGAERFTDTTMIPLGLVDLDLVAATLRFVPGGETAIAYAPAPDGGIWLVRRVTPRTLMHIAPGSDTPDVIGTFADSVADLANVDGLPVAAVGAGGLQWLDAGGNLQMMESPAGPIFRVAAVSGRRVIVEVEATGKLFGDRANLWLVQIP